VFIEKIKSLEINSKAIFLAKNFLGRRLNEKIFREKALSQTGISRYFIFLIFF
jgi:hypothetical protein